jgi:tetratricopeptide (TPR) repeat protein
MKTRLSMMLLIFILAATTGVAFRNDCKTCRFVAEPDDLICKTCGKYLNLCLICQHPNLVQSDSCEICCNPLVESRIMSTIPPDVREGFHLGKSPRAVLERENSRLHCLLGRTPDQEAHLLFQLAMNLKRMNFYAREAEAWGTFLEKFPSHPQAQAARIYRSEAFRNWGFLVFREDNLQEAEQLMRAAVAENPHSVDALVWLGRVELALGKVSEARHSLRIALAIEPGNRGARSLLRADSRPFRHAPPHGPETPRLDPTEEMEETAQWFPGVSIQSLK